MIRGNVVGGVLVKGRPACMWVGEEQAILEAILAFMDCILELKMHYREFEFPH